MSTLPSTRRQRAGFVLLAVLIVVVLLTLAAYQFGELMLAEYRAADSHVRAAQARALADSGVHYAAAILSDPNAFSGILNSNPYSSPAAFQDVLVSPSDQPRRQGRFSVVAPFDPDDPAAGSQPCRFGVSDESGKINLNALMRLDSSGRIAHDMLMALPNMTEDVANSILDWIDTDDDPRPDGAENDYYEAQLPPYGCKNGPLDTIEELLLVKGVTPQLLLGNDRNRNGILDPGEDDGSGVVNAGLAGYVTVYSREQNVDAQGNPRLYVNDRDLQGLYQKLSTAVGQDLANYILAYRLYGPASNQGSSSGGGASRSGGGPSGGGGAGGSGGAGGARAAGGGAGPSGGGGGGTGLGRNMLDFNQARPRSISSLYELIGSQVAIPGTGRNAPPTYYPSPLNDPGSVRQLLPLLLDAVTTVQGSEIPARVNVNTAPRAVLTALPGLADADVQGILDHRPSPSDSTAPDPIYETPAWLITEANLPASTLRTLERYITTRSQVYRVQTVGYFDGGGAVARVEAVIDTNHGAPRILYRRDLTELGRSYPIGGSAAASPSAAP